MNRHWVCCCALFVTVIAPAQEDFPLKQEDIHLLIREVAARIEDRFKGAHPEADGLVQHVAEALSTPPPPPKDEGDRARRIARHMTLVTAQAGFKCSINGPRGAVFDNEDTGHLQHYHDLENAQTVDAEEVWRWLEMKHAAKQLKWEDKEEVCTQRALGAARAFVSREPKNAGAHTLLALALDWGAEKLAALQTALKLDPKQPLALHAMLERRMEKALEAAALRQETALDEEAPREPERALFDQPLSEEERLALEKQQDALRREAGKILLMARERGDLTAYLKTVNLLAELRHQQRKGMLAANRAEGEPFESFRAKSTMAMLDSIFSVFDDDGHLRTALTLAGDDAEASGAILLMALMGDAMHAARDKRPPTAARQEIFGQKLAALVVLAGADESKQAARAAEAAGIVELGLMISMQRMPQHLELLLRAVRLDPFRQRTQGLLMGLCMSKDDLSGACALTQTQLALLPDLRIRRFCAAATAALHDWSAAHRHLDACLKEKPDDLALLCQKAVTYLRESQSRSAVKKAESIFNKIIPRLSQNDALEKDDRAVVTENIIRFHLIAGQNDTARTALAAARRDKVLDEKASAELEALLP